VNEISADDVIECACGSTSFNVRRDGLLECVECRHPVEDMMAYQADVRGFLVELGVMIADGDVSIH
jgi:hypothetical protein